MVKILGTLFCSLIVWSVRIDRVSAQESVVENMCNGAFDLLEETCSTTISIPTGVEVEYKKACTNNCCDWDCGQCTNNWCCWGGLFSGSCGWNAGRCGQTCLPCSGCSLQQCGETCTDVPDTLRLVETDYSLCDLAETAIPGGIDAVQAASQWCPCLSQVTEYLAGGLLEKIDNLEYNEATVTALGAVGDIVDCIADNTDGIDSEKDEIIENVKSGKGIVLFGPEIGLQQYTQFVGAVVLCVFGGKCDDIFTLMKDIFVDTVSMIGADLAREIRRYYIGTIYGPVRDTVDIFTDVDESFQQVSTKLVKEVESCAQEVTNEKRAELEALVATYNETQKVLVSKVEVVVDLGVKIKNAYDAVEGALDAMEAALDALDTPFVTQIENLFVNGETPEVYEAVSFLVQNQDIQTVVEAAKAGVSFLQSLPQHANEVKEQLSTLEEALLNLLLFEEQEACEFDTNFLGELEWFFTALRGLVTELFDEVEEALDNPIDGIQFEADVASYSSEWKIRITNLPCSRLDRQTFSNDLCPGCSPIVVDVPEFYPCSYEMTVPLPKEHTPYLRLILPSNDV